MSAETELLESLRIERGEWRGASRSRSPRRVVRWWAVAAILAVMVVASWFVYSRTDGIPVKVAIARTVVEDAGTAQLSREQVLEASGFVIARHKATVSAKMTGRIQKLYIQVGQRVAAGDILAKLDDANTKAALRQSLAGVAQAESSLTAANTAARDMAPIYDSNVKQAAAGLISAQALQTSKSSYDALGAAVTVAEANLAVARAALAAAQRAEDDTIVGAPFDGVIVDQGAQQGEIVSPASGGAGGIARSGICTLVDMQSLDVEVNIGEAFLDRIHAGQPVAIKLNAYADLTIQGIVDAIVPTADRNKGTVAVRIAIQQPDPRILPELSAHVSFLSEAPAGGTRQPAADRAGVMVPIEAVRATGTGNEGEVFIVDDNRVKARSVVLGRRETQGQTIVSGLDAGDHVAIGDVSRLTDRSKIRIMNH